MGGCGLLNEGVSRIARVGVNAVFPLRCWQCASLYVSDKSDGHQDHEDTVISFDRLMTTCLCLCSACGRPFRTDHGVDHSCPDCQADPPAFEMARAAGIYDFPFKTLIHHYKYQGRAELARPFGKLLWSALMRCYDPLEFDRIIPVPLHWYRRFRRGFNQAVLLLKDWRRYAEADGLPWDHRLISTHVLVRRRRTLAQARLGKDERAANLKDAFNVSRREDVKGRRILLVDDVLTTGVTAAECAKALIHAGAAVVKVLTLARAA